MTSFPFKPLGATPTYRAYIDAVIDTMAYEEGRKKPTGITRLAARRALAVISITEGVNHYWNLCNWVEPSNYPAFNSIGVRMYPNANTGAYLNGYEFCNNPRWQDFVTAVLTSKTRKPALRAMAVQYASWSAPKTADDWYAYFMQFSTLSAISRLNMTMIGI